MINELIETAQKKGASDLHLESGLPAVYRVSGNLVVQGGPVTSEELNGVARQIVGNENWPDPGHRRKAGKAYKVHHGASPHRFLNISSTSP